MLYSGISSPRHGISKTEPTDRLQEKSQLIYTSSSKIWMRQYSGLGPLDHSEVGLSLSEASALLEER